MTSLFELYKSTNAPLSPQYLCWNMYGPGLENIGRKGKPENCPLPLPDMYQLPTVQQQLAWMLQLRVHIN